MGEERWEKTWVLMLFSVIRVALIVALVAALMVQNQNGARAVSLKEAVTCSAQDGGTRMLVPLGRTVGIKLFSQGVMVVGLSDIDTSEGTSSPAKACGLRTGDIITHINSEKVDTIEAVETLLQTLDGEDMSLRALRDGKQIQLTAAAVQSTADGSYKLGAWIRDSMAGIGTLTYYDPETGSFAALGHGINDVDTCKLMPLQSGAIMPSSVTGVKKGAQGAPGELHGSFDLTRDVGSLYANTDCGVFGTLTDSEDYLGGEALPAATRSQVRVGDATILSNICGDQVEEYTVEIMRLYPENGDSRNLMVKVTDPRLLEAAGGIVQGMSGSPILQDGRLVGAVTHVLLSDPTCGYGILIENMLEAGTVE